MNKKSLLPTTLLLAAIIVMAAIHLLIPCKNFPFIPWGILGLVSLMTGVAFNLFADSAFKKNETTVKPFQESRMLVTNGVFRITRNPMYLGFILILLGIACMLGSFTPFSVIPFFFVFVRQYYIVAEEKMLEEQFQSAWQDYSRRVRRWI